jgi:toxin CcdB
MAQFDVHRNSGKNRNSIPYVVVQSTLFDDYKRRVVVPLVRASEGKVTNPRFNPTFKIGNSSVVLHPLETVSVAIENLGKPVDSLAQEAGRIIGAMDELLRRV